MTMFGIKEGNCSTKTSKPVVVQPDL